MIDPDRLVDDHELREGRAEARDRALHGEDVLPWLPPAVKRALRRHVAAFVPMVVYRGGAFWSLWPADMEAMLR